MAEDRAAALMSVIERKAEEAREALDEVNDSLACDDFGLALAATHHLAKLLEKAERAQNLLDDLEREERRNA